MNATILPLPGIRAPIQQIGHFIRIGHVGHKIESLLEQGRFPAGRVVVEASELKSQRDLLSAFKSRGIEIVLDTNVAELSEIGRFDGLAKSAPWAQNGGGGPLRPEHFRKDHPDDLLGTIARVAVKFKVDAILAPCHFLFYGSKDGWFDVDRKSCELLRDALDREGGGNISIDYPLMSTYADLRDDAVRGFFVAGLQSLPFENLWIRTSGFGSDATPVGCKRYLSALANIHNLGKPIIADSLGGLVGLSSLAFGMISGISHGIGENERFNAAGWNKPRKKVEEGKPGGGRSIRIPIPGLDKSLTESELKSLAAVSGGHRLVVCRDRNCCAHGVDDMISNWRSHALHRAVNSIKELEAIPDQRRARHFLDNEMTNATRIAHQISSLNVADLDLSARLKKHSRKMDEMRSTLNNFYEIRGDLMPRAAALNARIGQHQSQTERNPK